MNGEPGNEATLNRSLALQCHMQSRPQTSSGAYVASSITCGILKAIRVGVGFRSGTETMPHGTDQMKHADLPNA